MCIVKAATYKHIICRKKASYDKHMIFDYCIKNIKISTGNCVILEGTGDLDHYSCVEKFNSSCPLEFYNDEEIYKCE